MLISFIYSYLETFFVMFYLLFYFILVSGASARSRVYNATRPDFIDPVSGLALLYSCVDHILPWEKSARFS